MAVVRLQIAPDPSNVRLVRLVVTAVCRLSELPPSTLDDVRLAAGEACGRAVSAQRAAGIDDPVRIDMDSSTSTMTVTVQDRAPDQVRRPSVDREDSVVTDLGNAVRMPDPLDIVAGLTDDLDVESSGRGSTVEMRWAIRAR